MITGVKRRRADEPGADARPAHPIALLAALVLASATTAALVAQPIPSGFASSGVEHDDHDGPEDD